MFKKFGLSLFAVPLLLSCNSHDLHTTPDQIRAKVQDLRDKIGAITPVRYSDIHSWRSMGERWVAGQDAAGKVLAIYDLSYPTLFGQIPLGRVGKSLSDKVTRDDLLKAFRSAQNRAVNDDAKNVLEATIELLAANDPFAGIRKEFSSDWWKKLPWKSADVSRSNHAPERFKLSDLDYSYATKRPDAATPSAIEQLESLRDLNEETPLLGKGFLSRIEFVKAGDGEYDMTFTPEVSELAVSHPVKVADLKTPYSGLVNQIGQELAQLALSQGVSLVPVPVLTALLGTALDRFFHYTSLTRDTHEDMAIEMLNSISDQNGRQSPFGSLTKDERQSASVSALYSKSSLWNSALLFIGNNPAGAWQKQLAKDNAFSLTNSTQMSQSGYNLFNLNQRFAFAQNDQGKSLVLLAKSCYLKSSGACAAVDYSNPNAATQFRAGFEALATAVHFGAHFIPYGGFIVNFGFNQFLASPMDDLKGWEARLSGQLGERTSAGTEDWSWEMGMIQTQQINPLELSRSAWKDLAANRRRGMGI